MTGEEKILARLEALGRKVGKQLASMDSYMRTELVTKDEFYRNKVETDTYMREQLATKEELFAVEKRLGDQIDGLAGHHLKLDIEQSALRAGAERLDGRVARLEARQNPSA